MFSLCLHGFLQTSARLAGCHFLRLDQRGRDSARRPVPTVRAATRATDLSRSAAALPGFARMDSKRPPMTKVLFILLLVGMVLLYGPVYYTKQQFNFNIYANLVFFTHMKPFQMIKEVKSRFSLIRWVHSGQRAVSLEYSYKKR